MCIHAYQDIPASCTQPNVCTIFFKYESMYAIMYSIPIKQIAFESTQPESNVAHEHTFGVFFYSSKKCQNAEIQINSSWIVYDAHICIHTYMYIYIHEDFSRCICMHACTCSHMLMFTCGADAYTCT
jgi:hypothetical protein